MYYIGIDLGTTNCVLAYTEQSDESPDLKLFLIDQLVDASTIEGRTSLPSFIYLASETSDVYSLPWAKDRDYAVGTWATRLSDSQPHRVVDKAKSWLCYNRVDRHDALLPFNSGQEPDENIVKISPVEASRRYLEHMASAWNYAHPEAPLSEQTVVLTVPASFDAAARELTREAALAAGLPENFTLLEEPQAAVYAWLAKTGDKWRKQLNEDDVLLVCDVGGGTSDFSLVNVEQENGELFLNRLAVGNHLLVGGDNMDLATAYFASQKFAEKGVTLDPWQNAALQHAARNAKERLLSDNAPKSHTIVIAGRGRKLFASNVSVEVTKDEILNLLQEGFFPQCASTDRPQRNRLSGFRQLGLPYESDAAITRHLSAFLQDHLSDGTFPTHVLFNGGVFKSQVLKNRMFDTIASWSSQNRESSEANFNLLEAQSDLDNSVALGAAYYAWAKDNGGIRIKGGTGRSYYVGIETAGLALPGMPRPMNALCVAPMGMEEGTETDVPSTAMEIGLAVGQQEKFRIFSSSTRKEDKPGTLLTHWSPDELEETDSLETTLAPAGDAQDDFVPIQFHSVVTELGMFELWCQSVNSPDKWKLEFSVREEE
ncbi:MAG: Hsp70 family protein [Thermoguttaceae bacterium]|nr:Hsp70 family protein [Thermoguttaceae bacterium]